MGAGMSAGMTLVVPSQIHASMTRAISARSRGLRSSLPRASVVIR